MEGLAKKLKNLGQVVKLPVFDDYPGIDSLGVFSCNRKTIDWADILYFYWDGRSVGAVADFGMIFQSRKPFRLMYLEQKSVAGAMKGYEKLFEHYPWPI